jgi:hypothetical protein
MELDLPRFVWNNTTGVISMYVSKASALVDDWALPHGLFTRLSWASSQYSTLGITGLLTGS